MTAIKRTVFLILIAAGCALSAQTYKKSTSCEDMFILACLGDALSVYSSGTKQFIVIREHISDVSIASEGTVLYRDHAKNLFLGKLKQQDNGLSITDEMEIDSTLIDKQTKLIVSNDGGFVFGYKGNIIIIFCLTENKIAKKSELQIEGGIALPSFSPDSKSAAFYNIGRSGGCSVMIFDIASNSVSKLAEVRSHSISLSGEYAQSIPPQWDLKCEYITAEGRFHDKKTNSAISIIRLSDKTVKPAPSYLWADADHLACFEFQQKKFGYACVDIHSIFVKPEPADLSLMILPVHDFPGLETIFSMGNNSGYIFQDFYRHFYFYNSTNNTLVKLCRAKTAASKIFVLDKAKISPPKKPPYNSR